MFLCGVSDVDFQTCREGSGVLRHATTHMFTAVNANSAAQAASADERTSWGAIEFLKNTPSEEIESMSIVGSADVPPGPRSRFSISSSFSFFLYVPETFLFSQPRRRSIADNFLETVDLWDQFHAR